MEPLNQEKEQLLRSSIDLIILNLGLRLKGRPDNQIYPIASMCMENQDGSNGGDFDDSMDENVLIIKPIRIIVGQGR